jgi:biogenesis of lysosome-related organelles complex 1 subunit KXD1
MAHKKQPSINSKIFAIPDNEEEDDIECSSSVSSYAGSAEAMDQGQFSAVNFLTEEFMAAFDPTTLDNSIAVQAQTSGLLHAKQQELESVHKFAVARLQELKTEFANRMKNVKETERDLEYCQKKVQLLMKRAKDLYPIEYVRAREEIIAERD